MQLTYNTSCTGTSWAIMTSSWNKQSLVTRKTVAHTHLPSTTVGAIALANNTWPFKWTDSFTIDITVTGKSTHVLIAWMHHSVYSLPFSFELVSIITWLLCRYMLYGYNFSTDLNDATSDYYCRGWRVTSDGYRSLRISFLTCVYCRNRLRVFLDILGKSLQESHTTTDLIENGDIVVGFR